MISILKEIFVCSGMKNASQRFDPQVRKGSVTYKSITDERRNER
jgi:hypothetical protein